MTIKLHDLRPAPGAKTTKTRVGRGEGSKGKTAGRGTKGTKARNQVPVGFEGGQMPIHMRLPKLKGFKNRFRTAYEVVNVGDINRLFPGGGEVIEGYVPEARDHWLEAFLNLFLPGSRDPGQGSSVERIESGQDLESTFVMPKFSGQFVEAFVGFGPGIGEEDFSGGQVADDALCQTSLWGIVIKVGDVNESAGLIDQGFRDFRVSMAEGANGNTTAQIEVALTGYIPDIRTGTMA